MLLFSTLLDINPTLTVDGFIRLAIEWNQKSLYASNVIPGINWNGEHSVRFGSEDNWLAVEEYKSKKITAIRHEKRTSDGVIWDTEFVMNFEDMKMSVRLDRSYADQVKGIDAAFSTPHFITLLIRDGYLADDKDLPILREPMVLDKETIGLVADVINGTTSYRLPIVFISKTFDNDDPVNTAILAGRLKGVAHVLVQKNLESNDTLRQLCSDRNEFNGAIGIYFPNGVPEHRRYLYRASTGFDEMLMERIIRQVIHYSNTQMMAPLYTWQGVTNAILLDRLAGQRAERLAAEQAKRDAEARILQLREEQDEEKRVFERKALEKAKAEAERMIEAFDEETEKMRQEIERLTKVNEALQYENQGLRAKLEAVDQEPILYMGDEFEFYPGEIKELILSVLEDTIPNLFRGSRRFDVINDIVQNNNYLRVPKERAAEIKKLLGTYTGLPARLKQDLEAFGFRITGDGKHYKLVYFGDDRYVFTLAKTPSDVRAGKNDAQGIIRRVL